MEFYNQSIEEVQKNLSTTRKGITKHEAQLRLKKYGLNELQAHKKINPIVIFLQQFNSAVVYILIAATIISFVLGEHVDAFVILAILIFNAIFGFIQEYKAEKSIEALKKLASPHAKVMRNGVIQEIDAKQIVPGDILLLEEGDSIPADARLIETVHVQVQEAALTGESSPVSKQIQAIDGTLALGDQKNMVFAGTVVVAGRAKAVVTATGMQRQIGKIAHLIETAEKIATPLQQKLDKLGRVLGVGTILVCLVVFAAAVFKGEAMLPAFLAAVALAVAAIPEGLPAVVTISLALGVQRMVKKNALVRKLPSVETLGCTTVICTDKTGTLTKNEMTVRRLFTNNEDIEVSGSGYKVEGEFFIDGKKIDPKEVKQLLKIGLLNNNATIDTSKETEAVIGDPTEGCLLVSAQKAGLKREALEKEEPRIDEVVFNSTRKRMSTVHKVGKKIFMYTKGAPDIVLSLCTKIEVNGKVKKITPAQKKRILEKNEEFARSALRVLAFAYKECAPKKKDTDYDESDEKDLIFVGLQGMIDPPRPEVKDSIATCKQAGIRVVMITGDFASTAKAIGKEIGLGANVMSGSDLDKVESIDKIIDNVNIFARVNPEHKLRIVEALQKKGHVVAMTGDGVNDAPALKKADIGVAMGITGTDVSKEASDMILTDDNFTSIVSAVEEGRGIYGNIKKYFSFLLSGNISEVLIVFIITLMGFPLPLIAAQILLINLVTDGFPALALGVDPFERGAMKQRPRKKEEPLWKGLGPYLYVYPVVMTLCAIAVFTYTYNIEGNLIKAQTMTFLLISFFELFQAFACRSTIDSSFSVGLFKNNWLIGAVGLSATIALAVIYVPALQGLFGTVALSLVELVTIIIIASFGAMSIEISKTLKRGSAKTTAA